MATTRSASMEVRRRKKKFLGTIPESSEEELTLIPNGTPPNSTNIVIEDEGQAAAAAAANNSTAPKPMTRFLSKFAVAFSAAASKDTRTPTRGAPPTGRLVDYSTEAVEKFMAIERERERLLNNSLESGTDSSCDSSDNSEHDSDRVDGSPIAASAAQIPRPKLRTSIARETPHSRNTIAAKPPPSGDRATVKELTSSQDQATENEIDLIDFFSPPLEISPKSIISNVSTVPNSEPNTVENKFSLWSSDSLEIKKNNLHSAPAKPMRQVYRPPTAPPAPPNGANFEALTIYKVEKEKMQAEHRARMRALEPIVASSLFGRGGGAAADFDAPSVYAGIKPPASPVLSTLPRIGASRRRQFKAFTKVCLTLNASAASVKQHADDAANQNGGEANLYQNGVRTLPRTSKSLPRAAASEVSRPARSVSPILRHRMGRGRTIQKCVISLSKAAYLQNPQNLYQQKQINNSRVGSKRLEESASCQSLKKFCQQQQKQQLCQANETQPRNACGSERFNWKRIEAPHASVSSAAPIASGAEARSLSSSSSSLASDRVDATPTTFYRRRRQTLQDLKRGGRKFGEPSAAILPRHFAASEERDRELSVISRSFSLPESLQNAAVLRICVTSAESGEKLLFEKHADNHDPSAGRNLTLLTNSESSEEEDFTDSGIENSRPLSFYNSPEILPESENSHRGQPTKIKAEPALAKVDVSFLESEQPNSYRSHTVGQVLSRDSNEIDALAKFANRLNANDGNFYDRSAIYIRRYDSKADTVELPLSFVAQPNRRTVNLATPLSETRSLVYGSGKVNTTVNVDVSVFREQSANICASCTIPCKTNARDNYISSPKNKPKMRLLNANSQPNDISEFAAKVNDISQRRNENVRNLKAVDISLDDETENDEQATKGGARLPANLTPKISDANSKIINSATSESQPHDFEVFSLRLSLRDDENVCEAANNFGNTNAFGFAIAGAGGGMSRADRPTVSVESVREASAALRAGLKVGDLLLEINGQSTAGKYFYSIRRMLSDTVARATAAEEHAGHENCGVLNLRIQRPILHGIRYLQMGERSGDGSATISTPIDEMENKSTPFSSTLTSPSSPPYSQLTFAHSNNSSGIGSSISPSLSQKSGEQQITTTTNHTSLNGNMSAGHRQPYRTTSDSSTGGSYEEHSGGDYRVVSLDSRPTPGRLDDFIPEVERNSFGATGGTLKSLRAARNSANASEDANTKKFHSLDARRRSHGSGAAVRAALPSGGAPPSDAFEPRLIRNYDLHLPEDETQFLARSAELEDLLAAEWGTALEYLHKSPNCFNKSGNFCRIISNSEPISAHMESSSRAEGTGSPSRLVPGGHPENSIDYASIRDVASIRRRLEKLLNTSLEDRALPHAKTDANSTPGSGQDRSALANTVECGVRSGESSDDSVPESDSEDDSAFEAEQTPPDASDTPRGVADLSASTQQNLPPSDVTKTTAKSPVTILRYQKSELQFVPFAVKVEEKTNYLQAQQNVTAEDTDNSSQSSEEQQMAGNTAKILQIETEKFGFVAANAGVSDHSSKKEGKSATTDKRKEMGTAVEAGNSNQAQPNALRADESFRRSEIEPSAAVDADESSEGSEEGNHLILANVSPTASQKRRHRQIPEIRPVDSDNSISDEEEFFEVEPAENFPDLRLRLPLGPALASNIQRSLQSLQSPADAGPAAKWRYEPTPSPAIDESAIIQRSNQGESTAGCRLKSWKSAEDVVAAGGSAGARRDSARTRIKRISTNSGLQKSGDSILTSAPRIQSASSEPNVGVTTPVETRSPISVQSIALSAEARKEIFRKSSKSSTASSSSSRASETRVMEFYEADSGLNDEKVSQNRKSAPNNGKFGLSERKISANGAELGPRTGSGSSNCINNFLAQSRDKAFVPKSWPSALEDGVWRLERSPELDDYNDAYIMRCIIAIQAPDLLSAADMASLMEAEAIAIDKLLPRISDAQDVSASDSQKNAQHTFDTICASTGQTRQLDAKEATDASGRRALHFEAPASKRRAESAEDASDAERSSLTPLDEIPIHILPEASPDVSPRASRPQFPPPYFQQFALESQPSQYYYSEPSLAHRPYSDDSLQNRRVAPLQSADAGWRNAKLIEYSIKYEPQKWRRLKIDAPAGDKENRPARRVPIKYSRSDHPAPISASDSQIHRIPFQGRQNEMRGLLGASQGEEKQRKTLAPAHGHGKVMEIRALAPTETTQTETGQNGPDESPPPRFQRRNSRRASAGHAPGRKFGAKRTPPSSLSTNSSPALIRSRTEGNWQRELEPNRQGQKSIGSNATEVDDVPQIEARDAERLKRRAPKTNPKWPAGASAVPAKARAISKRDALAGDGVPRLRVVWARPVVCVDVVVWDETEDDGMEEDGADDCETKTFWRILDRGGCEMKMGVRISVEDPREWRKFVAEQRLPVPGDAASRNRIDADSRLQLIHPPAGADENGGDAAKMPRPIIKSVPKAARQPTTAGDSVPDADTHKQRPTVEKGAKTCDNGASQPNGAPPPIMTVSGNNRCAHCTEPLGRGAAMIVEALRLYYHLSCFRCYVCRMALGNGTRGADVRVRGAKLHCQKCFSADEHRLSLSRI